MSQKFSLYEDLNPYENLRFYLGILHGAAGTVEERIAWVLDMTRLQDVRHRQTGNCRLAGGSGWPWAALSSPAGYPLSDEPTSGVDPITRRNFWRFIGQLATEGITVFVTTHYMDEARHCGRIVMINEGKIVATGSPAEIIHQACP